MNELEFKRVKAHESLKTLFAKEGGSVFGIERELRKKSD